MNDLCIGGGGRDGFSFLGCLEYLDQKDLLDLKNFHGTSIGSLIGILYVLGTKPSQQLKFLLEMDMTSIVNYDFSNLTTDKKCILDDTLLNTLVNLIKEDDSTTIADVTNKTGVNINIYTTNLTTNKYYCFSNINTPNVKIKEAIKASMSIPFLFQPVIINGEKFVDGCCKNRYGLPFPDITILGYTIMLEPKMNDNSSYEQIIMETLIKNYNPRSIFTIYCKGLNNVSTYLNLNFIEKSLMLDMYKHGIEMCRTQLDH